MRACEARARVSPPSATAPPGVPSIGDQRAQPRRHVLVRMQQHDRRTERHRVRDAAEDTRPGSATVGGHDDQVHVGFAISSICVRFSETEGDVGGHAQVGLRFGDLCK
jgi:hypothetical protein